MRIFKCASAASSRVDLDTLSKWRRMCSAEQQQKYEALLRKEEEVKAYLEGFGSMQSELRADLAARSAEVRETLQKMATLQGVLKGAAPDKAALEEVQSALEYTSMQAESAAEASVRLFRLRLAQSQCLHCSDIPSQNQFQSPPLAHSHHVPVQED